jgi:hypothetical protein
MGLIFIWSWGGVDDFNVIIEMPKYLRFSERWPKWGASAKNCFKFQHLDYWVHEPRLVLGTNMLF